MCFSVKRWIPPLDTSPVGNSSSGGASFANIWHFCVPYFHRGCLLFSFPPLSSSRFTSRNIAIGFLTKEQKQLRKERDVCSTNGVWATLDIDIQKRNVGQNFTPHIRHVCSFQTPRGIFIKIVLGTKSQESPQSRTERPLSLTLMEYNNKSVLKRMSAPGGKSFLCCSRLYPQSLEWCWAPAF